MPTTATDRPAPDPGDSILSPREAAERLGLKTSTLAAMRHEGRGPAFMKHGRIIRYRTSDLAAWVEENITRPDASQG